MAVIEPKNSRLRIERFEYRIVFSKTGRAIYISNLDMKRAFQRILKRSKLPVWYTQGFNPQIYLNIMIPLSLGIESRCEVMDIMLTEEISCEEVKTRLADKMPEGFGVVSVGTPVHKHTEIAFSHYTVRITSDKSAQEMKELFEDFLSRETIEIEKRTKKKTTKLVDIKPHIFCEGLETDGEALVIKLKLPSSNDFSLNLNVVIDEFARLYEIDIDELCAERTKIAMENDEKFT